MNKIRRKITVSRFFQVLAYFLSFPLLVFLIWNGSRVLRDDQSVSKLMGWLPVLIGLGMLVLVGLIQLILRGALKKNRFARASIVGLITAVLLAGSVIVLDTAGKARYEKTAEEVKTENETELPRYELLATNFNDEIKYHSDMIEEWVERYNLNSYVGMNKGGANTDGVENIEENGVFYKPNGMYGDGYVFGVEDVRKILHDYYVIGEKIAKNEIEGLDNELMLSADELLKEELLMLETDPTSDWNKYKEGALESSISIEGFKYIVSSTEYEDAYGEDGTATKYYITPKRLDEILGRLGESLSIENTPEFQGLIDLVSGFIGEGEGLVAAIGQILADLPEMLNADLTLQKLVDYINNENLWSDTLKPLLGEQVLGVDVEDTLTTDFVYKLLPNLSYYQSSTTYPIMYFIENQALKDYAYAKYYGQKHGANVGSVLIPNSAPSDANLQYVGKITLDSKGSLAPTEDQVKYELIYFDNYDKFGKTLYPLLIARSYILKFGALAFFCLMLSYAFTQLVDNNFKKLRPIEEA